MLRKLFRGKLAAHARSRRSTEYYTITIADRTQGDGSKK